MTDQRLQELADDFDELRRQMLNDARAFDIRMEAIIAEQNKMNEQVTSMIRQLNDASRTIREHTGAHSRTHAND